MPETDEQLEERILHGVAGSPGVSHGKAFVYYQRELEIPAFRLPEDQHQNEVRRFEQALVTTRQQIAQIRGEIERKLGEAEAQIFDAHLLVLEDVALIDETITEQRETGYNIEYCFHSVAQRYIDFFDQLDDSYLKERVADIRDVAKRLLKNLMGQGTGPVLQLAQPRVLVSEDLSPSDTASVEKNRVLAIVTDAGSQTSHAVIMARSIQVPAVVGLHDATRTIDDGAELLVDGYDGIVIINPSEQTLYRYGKLASERESIRQRFGRALDEPSETRDGVPFILRANIGGIDDLESAREFKASGVGLFRTENIFMRGRGFPSEEEQYRLYRQVVEQMAPHPTVIRTLDLGGDKTIDGMVDADEDNPFMGFRAIRFCLQHQDVFLDQLRAILRASAHGPVKMMYPMISGCREIVQANRILEEARGQLRERGQPYDDNMPVGAMIEIPSAAYTSDLIARYSHFFSIGTNDLIQYLLAVDRVNDRIAHLYEPCHPAVIRTLHKVMQNARDAGIRVSVCGEMAGDPLYAPLLLGLGAHELSLSAPSILEVRYILRNSDFKDIESLAREVLAESDPDRNMHLLREFYMEKAASVIHPPQPQDH